MRPGQNKRMRGRNNNNNGGGRKGPNPLTRSYESNGPDVKIRGTAHHIGEKYLQLARDAQSSGDPVMAESYLQHAEHYFRLIASAQQAQQQAAYGYQRTPGEPEQDEDGDDDFESLPDRFASPAERAPQPPPPQPYAERQSFNGGDRQPYDGRQNYDRQAQNQPQANYDRPPQQQAGQPQPDRPAQPERQGYDRNQHDNRNNRSDTGRADTGRGENGRSDTGRGERGNYQDRGQTYQERSNGQSGQQDRNGQDRPPRDYDNRGYRNNRGPREYRENSQPREPRQPIADEPAAVGLPAFITTPTRVVPDSAASEPPAQPDVAVSQAPSEATDESNLHLRPRRRRRSKNELVGGEAEGREAAPASDAVEE